jgi:hypothetical protein
VDRFPSPAISDPVETITCNYTVTMGKRYILDEFNHRLDGTHWLSLGLMILE